MEGTAASRALSTPLGLGRCDSVTAATVALALALVPTTARAWVPALATTAATMRSCFQSTQ